MMRSPRFFSVACRAPNGEIIVQTEAIEKTWIGKQKWLKYPFLRGSLALLDSMALGSRALKFASKVQLEDQYQKCVCRSLHLPPILTPLLGEDSGKTPNTTRHPKPQYPNADMPLSPAKDPRWRYRPHDARELRDRHRAVRLSSEPHRRVVPAARGPHQRHADQLRLGDRQGRRDLPRPHRFAPGLAKDIREIFKYHGAEHKAINTLEADPAAESGVLQAAERVYTPPRCGTSFAITRGADPRDLHLHLYPPLPVRHPHASIFATLAVRVPMELLILPIISGIAYELLRIAGKFRNQGIVNFFFKPGIWSQFLTTREPDAPQIEVAPRSSLERPSIAAEESGQVVQDGAASK